MGLGPPKSEKYQPIVTFRCPSQTRDWLEEKGRLHGTTVSKTAAWAMEMAHEYVDAFDPLEKRIEEFQREEVVTRGEAVSRLLKLGLAAYDESRKRRK